MNDFSIKCNPLADTPLPAVQKPKQPEPTFAMPPVVPTQEAAVLTEVDCVQGWRDSFTQAIIEVDKTDHEAFEAALLTQFDRAEDPGRASVGSFFSDRPHYAAITTENRVGSYRRSVHDEAVAEIGAYAWGDTVVYAVYVDTVPVDLQPYVKQQIREDNYVSYK